MWFRGGWPSEEIAALLLNAEMNWTVHQSTGRPEKFGSKFEIKGTRRLESSVALVIGFSFPFRHKRLRNV